MGSVGQLRVPEVDDFVEDLVNQNEVLSDRLLSDSATEVLDDDCDAVEEFEEVGGGDVEASGGDYVEGGLFEVGEVDAFDVEDGFGISFG